MHARENIKNGFWFSFGFGVAILIIAAGCFRLTEAGLSLLVPKGETQMDEDVKKVNKEEMSVEDMCKAAIAGEIKPSVDLLEEVIGTPLELDLLPDGSVRFKKDSLLSTVGNDDFKDDMFALRAQIEETKGQTMLVIREHPALCSEIDMSTHPAQFREEAAKHSEMKANLMLAYRHLEDARMRFGKVIQAFDGGKSVYPR